MEGFGSKLSPLHFLMSVMVVLPRSSLTLKFLQSSIVLTLSDNGISSTIGVYPLFLLGDILALKHPNVDSMMSEVMLCTSSPFRRASSLLKYAMSMSASLLTLTQRDRPPESCPGSSLWDACCVVLRVSLP